jgi:hypothetical protein
MNATQDTEHAWTITLFDTSREEFVYAASIANLNVQSDTPSQRKNLRGRQSVSVVRRLGTAGADPAGYR